MNRPKYEAYKDHEDYKRDMVIYANHLEAENAKLKEQLSLIHDESRGLGQKCVEGTCEHNAYSLMLRKKDRDINKIKADAIREASEEVVLTMIEAVRLNDYADKIEKGEA